MIKKLYPTEYIASVYDLKLDELKAQGMKGIIFDIDITLVPQERMEQMIKLFQLFERILEPALRFTWYSNNQKTAF